MSMPEVIIASCGRTSILTIDDLSVLCRRHINSSQ